MSKKSVVITAGGTSEYIDEVRKITNSSSGKLGSLIAKEFLKNEEVENIYYICSKDAIEVFDDRVKMIKVVNTEDLKREVERILTSRKIDYFIHSMAVSDYLVSAVTTATLLAQSILEDEGVDLVSAIRNTTKVLGGSKISSDEDDLIFMLRPTPKIISLIKNSSPGTYLVGFKLLNGVSEERLIKVACELRDKNNCDLVVANDLCNIKNGQHKAYIIDTVDRMVIANNKEDIAKKLVKKIIKSEEVDN